MSIRSIPFTRREPRGVPSTTVVRVPAARDWKRTLWIWIFLLPTVVLYGLYTVYPIIASYWYSFVEWNGFEADQRFVGIQNYRAVLEDPFFWNSFKVTLLFMLLVVPARVLLSLLLAVVLNSPKLPLVGLLRSAFFIPVVTTTAIIGVVMRFVLDPASGPINNGLRMFGFEGVDFLGSESAALPTAAALWGVDVRKASDSQIFPVHPAPPPHQRGGRAAACFRFPTALQPAP